MTYPLAASTHSVAAGINFVCIGDFVPVDKVIDPSGV